MTLQIFATWIINLPVLPFLTLRQPKAKPGKISKRNRNKWWPKIFNRSGCPGRLVRAMRNEWLLPTCLCAASTSSIEYFSPGLCLCRSLLETAGLSFRVGLIFAGAGKWEIEERLVIYVIFWTKTMKLWIPKLKSEKKLHYFLTIRHAL